MIILVRHGETAYNKKKGQGTGESGEEKIRGWKDIPLDAGGIQQASETAKHIYDDYKKVQKVYSSPLIRAFTTAIKIADYYSLDPITDKALLPWNVGDFAGQLATKVIDKMNNLVKHPDQPCPNGESFNDFKTRYLTFLKSKILQSHNSNIILVSHTRNCQLARAWIAAGYPSDLSFDEKTMNDYSNEIPPASYLTIQTK